MIVSQLYVYPLKSGREVKLQQAEVETKGLVWDREFMLVSGSGKFITQRQFPQLAKVKVKINRHNQQNTNIILELEDNTFEAFSFDSSLSNPLIEVEIWGDRILAVDQGDEVANWFHRYLKLSEDKVCRLVRQSPEYVRSLAQKDFIYEARPIGLADSSPVMLTATASLAELNQRIMEIHLSQAMTIEMNRFRPNIVVETIEPFVEDNWSLIQIGSVRFKITKPCTRCIIANIDQQLGIKDRLKEPLNTLGTFRQLSEKGVMFGVNMIPQNEGIIKTGDRLEVLQTRS